MQSLLQLQTVKVHKNLLFKYEVLSIVISVLHTSSKALIFLGDLQYVVVVLKLNKIVNTLFQRSMEVDSLLYG